MTRTPTTTLKAMRTGREALRGFIDPGEWGREDDRADTILAFISEMPTPGADPALLPRRFGEIRTSLSTPLDEVGSLRLSVAEGTIRRPRGLLSEHRRV